MRVSSVLHLVHRPEGALRRYVREILWVHSEEPRVQVLLPETTLTLVLRQSGSASLRNETLPNAVVSGLQQRIRAVEHAPGSSLVIVRFTEVGAPAILHDRADLLYNRIRAGNETFPQIEAAAQMIRNSEGRSSIAEIARHSAMSQSTLERHFRATVGTSPKSLSRLARLQHICRLWDTGKTLTEIAFEAGYCDQPHMVHDFRLFTDMPPEDFFRSASPRNLPTF